MDEDKKYNEGLLEFEFKHLGFGHRAIEALQARLADPNRKDAFAIRDERWFLQGKMNLVIQLGDGNNAMLRVKSYDASLRKEIIIPELEIAGIDTVALDKKMGAVDWSEDLDRPGVREAAKEDPFLQQLIDLSVEVKRDLQLLKESGHPQGNEAMHGLTLKHWLDTPYEQYIPDALEFKNAYEIRHSFSRDDILWPTVKQARNLLEGSPVGREIISPVDGIPVVEWFSLNIHQKDLSGKYQLENIGFFDLRRKIDLLPITEQHNPAALQMIYLGLLDGNKSQAHFLHNGNDEVVNLAVNAGSQSVEISNRQRQVIVNTADLVKNEAVASGEANYSINLNNTVMKNENYNEANYEYNVGRLRQHGFPDTKNEELRGQMQQGKTQILLEFHSAEHAGVVRAVVHVEKADSGVYFPNRYQLELKRPESQYPRRQFFQIQNFKGHGNQYDTPWKMGVNLLRGGQVLNNWLREDGTSINEWRGLDFSQKTNAGYGYVSFDRQELDVAKRLDELPIQEKDKNDLRHSHVVRSIEMGNTQSVHLDMPGNPVIRLRANIPKRELDIIKNGHVISISQFNTELTEMMDPNIAMNPGNDRGIRDPGNDRSSENQTIVHPENVLPNDNQAERKNEGSKQDQAVSQNHDKTPAPVNNVSIISGIGTTQQKETRLASSNTEKINKVLTGIQIAPKPSRNPGNHQKHSL